ncbi:MAG: PcfB family protein [Oscillospiraceae bacterium]|nr:PcfB family protein [Oscillospiraceae bacterium]
MQEELENRSVVLTTRAAKITARTLAKMMEAALRKMRQRDRTVKPGRQSLKQLSQGGSLSSIEVTEGNIKAFEPVARKYGVNYDLKKDSSTDPPRWLVFFRAKDTDAMTAAFTEFNTKMVKRATDKPSTRAAMRQHEENIRKPVRNRVRHKRKDGPER